MRRRRLVGSPLLVTIVSLGQVNVTTYHNDNARTGQNLKEVTLTPANVNPATFGKLFSQNVDGYVFAQPLYLSKVVIGGKAHRVVFVATEHDSVYAFDADTKSGATALPLWKTSFIDPSAAVTTVSSPNDLGCRDIPVEVGITGTPVIDASTGTLYVVAKTKESGLFYQRLHALDVTNRAEKFGGPVTIQASVPGTGDGSSGGNVSFDPLRENQRAGLLLSNGTLYLSWGSHCDHTPAHGWVMAYSASTLQQIAVWNSTPNGSLGAVWQGGAAPSSDSSGVYVATGNGTFDRNAGGADLGDSVVRFGAPSGGTLPVKDYFTPFNQATLNTDDLDLGTSAPLILPALPAGSSPSHLIVAASKEGRIYLLNRGSLGGYHSAADRIVQELPGAVGPLFGMPAYWNNTVYFGGSNDNLKAFSFNTAGSGMLSGAPVSKSPEVFGFRGTTPSVSANGATAGIVWAIQTDAAPGKGPAVLHAYDATNLANEFYSSSQNGSRDTAGPAVKFSVPTVANGKVYVGCGGQLVVYGLLGAAAAATPSN